MDPVTIQLIGFAIQELVKNEPAIAAAFSKLMTKPDATPAEWRATFALAQTPWESFGTDQTVSLPPATTSNPAPATT